MGNRNFLKLNRDIRIGGQTVQLTFRKDDGINIQTWKQDSKQPLLSLTPNEKGIFSSRDIKEGEELLSLPWYNSLSMNKVQQQLPWLFNKIQDLELTAEDGLVVALLYYRYCMDDLSFDYSEWFSAMPEVLNSGLFFSDAEAELLNGSPAYIDLMNQRLDAKELFGRLKSLFKEQQFSKCAMTYDRLKWAYSVVDSRKIYTEAPNLDANGNPFITVVLAPFLDYFNHAEDAQAAYDFDYDESAIKVVALQPIKKGEQIFLNYGNQDCNSDLLIHYGFIDQSSTAKHCVNVLVEELLNTIPASDPQLIEKTELLTKAFEQNERMKLFKDSLTEELLKISKYLSYKNFSLLPYLKSLIDMKMKAYPTTMEEDRAIIEATTEFEKLSQRSKMSIIMRLQEKETLKEIGALIQVKIDQNELENNNSNTNSETQTDNNNNNNNNINNNNNNNNNKKSAKDELYIDINTDRYTLKDIKLTKDRYLLCGGGVNNDEQQQQQQQQVPYMSAPFHHPSMMPPHHGIGSPHHIHPHQGMMPQPPPPLPVGTATPHTQMMHHMMPPMMHPPFMPPHMNMNMNMNMMGMMHHPPPPPFHQPMGMPFMMNNNNEQQQQQQHIQLQTSEMINSTGYLDDNNITPTTSSNSNNNSNSSTPNNKSKPNVPTLAEIFDDLSSRFVINIPAEELESFDRLLFQIEAAFWFYDDFHREEHHSLPKYSLSEFTKVFFHHCPFLKPHKNQVEEILKQFSQYKTRVPVYGAIILNPGLDKALFVRGFHSSSWGFPKGKVNKDEADDICAVREVLEETGYDISSKLNPRHFIEITMKDQKIKLFIICGVPEDTPFMPRTRKEISKIEWLSIDELPTFTKKNNTQSMVKEKNFFRTIPFFIKLKRWIAIRKRGIKGMTDEGNAIMSTPKTIAQRPQQPTTPSSSTSSLQPPPQYSPYPMSPPASPRQYNNTAITPIKSSGNNSITNNNINNNNNTNNINIINSNNNNNESNFNNSNNINLSSTFPKVATAASVVTTAALLPTVGSTECKPRSKLTFDSKYTIKSTFSDAKDTIVSYPTIHVQNYQSRFNVTFDSEELVNCFKV
ncbi:mRNA-decapping enzyme 2 [Heterostelium album PN500]|uniref:mRNA-decapping enzyme 2 n=1 Tax=Heterostelium pallidum (strain ATCC 26659 / Pp 5 / PN500) TaxID=670386 RepID=D3BA13_HETP5|nr:mRNA-decapping enzyme 2 [Heterostelium album PN500]EFA81400.1 mRNA-decapping enzyme 2 [Heterostelium album PN500]|eukprot:XP_020433518.1 mRNA-decapping enzyme 2 [Heterostelium album PN500]